jgi:hypothetical protein
MLAMGSRHRSVVAIASIAVPVRLLTVRGRWSCLSLVGMAHSDYGRMSRVDASVQVGMRAEDLCWDLVLIISPRRGERALLNAFRVSDILLVCLSDARRIDSDGLVYTTRDLARLRACESLKEASSNRY